jgi:hypothetical protein
MIHTVDLYPTLVNVAGGRLGNNKPLDGMDVWGTISEGKPSPRTEIVYNIEPFRGEIEFKNMLERMHLSPALPGDLENVDAEQ